MIVPSADAYVFLKYGPLVNNKSKNGVFDFLLSPKHWSALRPSTKINSIFGGIMKINL